MSLSPAASPPTAPDGLYIASSATLRLGSKLSLAVDGKNLLIQDEKRSKPRARSYCGIYSGPPTTQSIPLYNVLWVDVGDVSVTISFARKTSKSTVKPASLTYPYDKDSVKDVENWAGMLLAAAYGDARPQKRFKVLVNPFGGQGNAATAWQKDARPLFEAAHCPMDVETTQYNGHGKDIAEKLDIDSYDALLCCSGDGIPHEVFNGLGKRPDAMRALKKIAVCQLPGGSGNAMCWNLTGTGSTSMAALAIVKSIPKPLDLISITQGDRRLLSFLSQSFGIVADVDLGTEDMRWMGGARFTVAFFQRVWGQTIYPCDVAVKVAIEDKKLIREHYRQGVTAGISTQPDEKGLPPLAYGDINTPVAEDWNMSHHATMGNFYAGNMAWMSAAANFFPAALPNDGMFDLVAIDGTLGRMDSIKTLLAVEKGAHFDMPHVSYRKVVAYRIIPHKREGVKEEYISIDGERAPFEPFQAEVHSGLGTVLAKEDLYIAPGV